MVPRIGAGAAASTERQELQRSESLLQQLWNDPFREIGDQARRQMVRLCTPEVRAKA